VLYQTILTSGLPPYGGNPFFCYTYEMVDTAKIIVKAGKGGDGLASFRREKYVPKGGPWGGDGGKGGDIIFKVDPHLNTLITFKTHKTYNAEGGKPGMKNLNTGRNGKDLIIKIPPGTIIKDNTGKQLYDLTKINDEIIISKGGRGGLGNWHFKSSINQTPMVATKGTIIDPLELNLELKLIADVGIIGLPSSGKSTLLNALTHANVKTADYIFTTLEPNLGVLQDHEIIIADIPGLIEGASDGKGLGHDFLKHIERTKLLIHVIDGGDLLNYPTEKIIDNYKIIQKELKDWSTNLTNKPQIVVINKIDMSEVKGKKDEIEKLFSKEDIKKLLFISAVTTEGLDLLTNEMIQSLSEISQEKAKQQNKPMDRILKLEDLKNRRIVFKRKQSAESEPK